MTTGPNRGSMQNVMSSLYRAYRPQVFEDVLGQEHICNSLVTALKKDLVGHAYLFSGPRGTGKTTLARLFARALNCSARPESQSPCNKCEVCLEIGEGKSVDIFEIDAASNRGIDEIRELRDRIAFAPTRAKYKVYIIDEVHMLTKEAFNALLKTLEEPPSHAVFILATTELHKVPETIISRCQRYAFHRASSDALSELLKKVMKKEKIEIDEDGLSALSRRAEGSYRDALTLLGNIASHEGKLDGDAVRQLLGLPPHDLVEKSVNLISEGNSEELVTILREFIRDGGDAAVLTKAIADYCKQGILEEESANRAELTKILEAVLVVLARARTSSDPTAIIVSQLLNLTMKSAPTAPKIVASPAPAMVDVAKVEKKSEEVPVSVDAVAPTPAPRAPLPADSNNFWNRFLEGIKSHNHALYMVIRSAALDGISDDTLTIAVKFRFYADRLQETRNQKLIEAVAAEVAGRPLKMAVVIRTELDFAVPSDDDLVRNVVDVFELEEVKS